MVIPYPKRNGAQVVVINDLSTHVGETGTVVNYQWDTLFEDWRYGIDFGNGNVLWFRADEVITP